MGLKCSLLGHRFGDPDVEREREERGSEVVTTTREVAVCERCEEKRVLSENKEVTAVIDESELGDRAATTGGPGADADDGIDAAPDAGIDAAPDDGIDAAPDDRPEPEPEPDGDDLVSEAVKNVQAERDAAGGMADIDVPEEDEGAEIMSDDGGESRERGYGEWPTEPGEEAEPWDPDAADATDTASTNAPGADPDGSASPDASDGPGERRDDPRDADEAASTDQRPFGTGTAGDVTPDTGAEIIDDGPDASTHQSDPAGDPGRDDPWSVDVDAPDTGAATEGTADAGAAGREGDGSEIIDAEDHQPDEPAPGEGTGASPSEAAGGSPSETTGGSPSETTGGSPSETTGGSPSETTGGSADERSGGSAGERSGGGDRDGAAGVDADDDRLDAESTEQSELSGGGAGGGGESSFEETEAATPSRPDAYECPACGFETTATNSPLRAGDPCPECSAYLVGSERKN